MQAYVKCKRQDVRLGKLLKQYKDANGIKGTNQQLIARDNGLLLQNRISYRAAA
jgi:hypothetical protein